MQSRFSEIEALLSLWVIVLVISLSLHPIHICATSRENLSSGPPSKRVSNRSSHLQRLARKQKFHLHQVNI